MDKNEIQRNKKLQEHAECGDLDGIKQAISDGADPKSNYSTALRNAAMNGHVECVKYLIPITEPKTGFSYALRAAAENGQTECVKLLIPVSSPSEQDSEALRHAASNGHIECVKLLIPVSDCDAALQSIWHDEPGDSSKTANIIETFKQQINLINNTEPNSENNRKCL